MSDQEKRGDVVVLVRMGRMAYAVKGVGRNQQVRELKTRPLPAREECGRVRYLRRA